MYHFLENYSPERTETCELLTFILWPLSLWGYNSRNISPIKNKEITWTTSTMKFDALQISLNPFL